MKRLWLSRWVEVDSTETGPVYVASPVIAAQAWMDEHRSGTVVDAGQVAHSVEDESVEVMVFEIDAPVECHDYIRAALGDECDLGEVE